MSFKLVAAVFDIKVGNPLRKMVLMKLADQANDKGECYPSYESIAKACEISRRSVITHIQWLEENGFLQVAKRYNAKENKNFSNLYRLTLDKAEKLEGGKTQKFNGETPAPASESISLGGANGSLGGETPAPSNGETPAPEPIIKPINEPINESGEESTPEKPESEISKSEKFAKPNFDEIKKYYSELKHPNPVEEAERFFDYYESNGWKVSKNPMKDWKAAVRNWIRRDNSNNQTRSQGQNHANHQPANSQNYDTSTTYGYASKLTDDANAYYAQRRTERANDGSGAIDVYSMESPL